MSANKHFRRKLTCLALLLAAAFSVGAQNPRIESFPITIGIADGLSQGMIYDILQDRDGFMWFATKDGLNRYDGYRFEVFTNDPFNPFSIADNDVLGWFEDSKGNLWLQLSSNKLDMYERSSGRFFHFEQWAEMPKLASPGKIRETPDGNIWVASEDGLYRLRRRSGDHAHLPDDPDLSHSFSTELFLAPGKGEPKIGILELSAEEDGTLLAYMGKRGLYALKPGSSSFVKIGQPDIEPWRVCYGANGRQYIISSDRRLFTLQQGDAKEIPLPVKFQDHLLMSIVPDLEGNLVLGFADDEGLVRYFSTPEASMLANGFPASLRLIFDTGRYCPSSKVDRSGNLWVGTDGYGLLKINLSRQPFLHFLEGKSLRKILFGDAIYFSHFLNGRFMFDEPSNTLQLPTGFPPGFTIYSLLRAKNGDTYFSGHDQSGQHLLGIRHGATVDLRKIAPTDEFSPIIEDAKGNCWLGANGSRLMCISAADHKTAYFDFSRLLGTNAAVYALYLDAAQNLWVGTMNGVLKLDVGKLDIGKLGDSIISNIPISQYQTNPSNPRSLRHNFATSFCPDPLEPERYLWVGTKGGGLNLLDLQSNDFQHFTSQNSGLPNDVVYGILPDGLGNIWCSTNRGLSRLTVSANSQQPTANSQAPTARRTYRFRNFREIDGLQSDEFNSGSFASGNDGRLFFGGVNGLTVFDPAKIQERESDARTLITGLKINNLSVDYLAPHSPLSRPIHQTEHLRLHYTQSLVTLEFALMDFVMPTENRYRYRLQGVDPDWVEAGTSHVANYARLRPGSYIFEVQGSIGYGEWSAPASLNITVMPPWYSAWWACLLYVLALGAAVYSFYKIRLRQKLEHQESLRLRELDEFKSRFFTNITHEFRTPLTVILGMSEQLATGSEQWAVAQERPVVRGKLGLIKRNGENLLRLINQILDLAKLESNSLKINYVQGDVLPYLRYIAESLHSMSNAQNVMLRMENSEAGIVMDYDPERLLSVVHNLLSNAIKFTPSGGRVSLRAEQLTNHGDFKNHHDFVHLTVSDTGVGIPPEDLPKIFDRFYQVESAVSSFPKGIPSERTNSTGGGTGIGLSLTKELVKAMGGEISVKSEVGKGTTFTVQLPISNTAPTSTENLGDNFPKGTPSEKLPPKLPDDDGTEQPSILLIEDNPDVVEYLAACLGENYQLDFAYNGRAGIEKALETVPDLILSDVMMPEKDGFEVCDFLKNDERTSHIPIVLLTAKADVESRIAGLKRGADAYLAKPFHQEELAVTLANLLELRRKLQARYLNSEFGMGYGEFPVAGGESAPGDYAFRIPNSEFENEFLKKLRLIVEENLSNTELDGEMICRKIGMSRSNLHAKLSALTGMPISHFVRALRLRRAKELLTTTEMNVSEVAYEVGFDNPKYFTRLFSEEFGMPPSEFRWRG